MKWTVRFSMLTGVRESKANDITIHVCGGQMPLRRQKKKIYAKQPGKMKM